MKCELITRVIVSTDSEIYADIAKEFGAEVPILRPENLSRDNSMARDVYLHMVSYLEKSENLKIKNFCVLLPTSPLRTHKHISEAINIYNDYNGKKQHIPIKFQGT